MNVPGKLPIARALDSQGVDVFLAVLKAVGAFVPFDPSYSAKRPRSMLEDGHCWRIEESGKERARISYAQEENGRLAFMGADPKKSPVHACSTRQAVLPHPAFPDTY
jgi:non-ribosomal peptide synthetase component F